MLAPPSSVPKHMSIGCRWARGRQLTLSDQKEYFIPCDIIFINKTWNKEDVLCYHFKHLPRQLLSVLSLYFPSHPRWWEAVNYFLFLDYFSTWLLLILLDCQYLNSGVFSLSFNVFSSLWIRGMSERTDW